jgi:hypothetical protein
VGDRNNNDQGGVPIWRGPKLELVKPTETQKCTRLTLISQQPPTLFIIIPQRLIAAADCVRGKRFILRRKRGEKNKHLSRKMYKSFGENSYRSLYMSMFIQRVP